MQAETAGSKTLFFSLSIRLNILLLSMAHKPEKPYQIALIIRTLSAGLYPAHIITGLKIANSLPAGSLIPYFSIFLTLPLIIIRVAS
jgi:hypothetical protein